MAILNGSDIEWTDLGTRIVISNGALGWNGNQPVDSSTPQEPFKREFLTTREGGEKTGET